MNTQAVVLVFTVVVALSAALLAWLAFDIGTTTLTRYRATFTERASFQTREFFLFIDPRKLFAANMAVMFLGALALWLLSGSLLIAVAAFALLALLPRFIYRWMHQKRLKTFEEQLPDALMLLSGGMRAGVALSAAIQQLVRESQPPLSQEFGLFLREQRLGVPMEQALSHLNRRVPTQTVTLVVSAMRVANETGGSLAETLEIGRAHV